MLCGVAYQCEKWLFSRISSPNKNKKTKLVVHHNGSREHCRIAPGADPPLVLLHRFVQREYYHEGHTLASLPASHPWCVLRGLLWSSERIALQTDRHCPGDRNRSATAVKNQGEVPRSSYWKPQENNNKKIPNTVCMNELYMVGLPEENFLCSVRGHLVISGIITALLSLRAFFCLFPRQDFTH